MWIPHKKIANRVFFSFPSYLPFWSYDPLKIFEKKSCQQDISKSIKARGLKLGQLIGDDEYEGCSRNTRKSFITLPLLLEFY